MQRFEEAITAYEHDIAICDELDDHYGQAQTLINLGEVHAELDDPHQARRAWTAAAQMFAAVGLFARRWVFKRAVLDRLLAIRPELRWVLIGDDGDEDPSLFADLAERAPGRVAAIGLRQVVLPQLSHPAAMGDAPVVAAPNAEELLLQLRALIGLEQPRGSPLHHWLLTGFERGNAASSLRPWTEGNDIHPLVHGSAYFAVARDALAAAADGDIVMFSGWRADTDERLGVDGHTVGDALCAAARRGATVRGLLWRSYPTAVGYFRGVNRALAQDVAAAGGRVLLDQGNRPFGCHHQKFLTVRYARNPADDVAFLGGIDLAAGRRDDDAHLGDPQTVASSRWYGPTPPWHDVQLQVRGPAVCDVADVFRERWRRRAAPPSVVSPPAAGSCAVQILRTYPEPPLHVRVARDGVVRPRAHVEVLRDRPAWRGPGYTAHPPRQGAVARRGPGHPLDLRTARERVCAPGSRRFHAGGQRRRWASRLRGRFT